MLEAFEERNDYRFSYEHNTFISFLQSQSRTILPIPSLFTAFSLNIVYNAIQREEKAHSLSNLCYLWKYYTLLPYAVIDVILCSCIFDLLT